MCKCNSERNAMVQPHADISIAPSAHDQWLGGRQLTIGWNVMSFCCQVPQSELLGACSSQYLSRDFAVAGITGDWHHYTGHLLKLPGKFTMLISSAASSRSFRASELLAACITWFPWSCIKQQKFSSSKSTSDNSGGKSWSPSTADMTDMCYAAYS